MGRWVACYRNAPDNRTPGFPDQNPPSARAPDREGHGQRHDWQCECLRHFHRAEERHEDGSSVETEGSAAGH